jgi:hypothetical protein
MIAVATIPKPNIAFPALSTSILCPGDEGIEGAEGAENLAVSADEVGWTNEPLSVMVGSNACCPK